MGKKYAEKTLGSSKILNLKGSLVEHLEIMHRIQRPFKCIAELRRKSVNFLGTKKKGGTENRAAHSHVVTWLP